MRETSETKDTEETKEDEVMRLLPGRKLSMGRLSHLHEASCRIFWTGKETLLQSVAATIFSNSDKKVKDAPAL